MEVQVASWLFIYKNTNEMLKGKEPYQEITSILRKITKVDHVEI